MTCARWSQKVPTESLYCGGGVGGRGASAALLDNNVILKTQRENELKISEIYINSMFLLGSKGYIIDSCTDLRAAHSRDSRVGGSGGA